MVKGCVGMVLAGGEGVESSWGGDILGCGVSGMMLGWPFGEAAPLTRDSGISGATSEHPTAHSPRQP